MKNSPGSMMGGIGLTTWVREVQLSRTIASASSTCSSSTPRTMVAFDCFRKPPEECSLVARYSCSRSESTNAPASSLCTIATISFTSPSIGRREGAPKWRRRRSKPAGQASGPDRRCTIAVRRRFLPEPAVTDAARPSSPEPLRLLAELAEAVAHGDDLDTTLGRLLATSAVALGASRAAVAVQDPDRATLELAATYGMDQDEIDRTRPSLEDPSSTFVAAVRSRQASWDRAGT